jgi:hypothetical protein
MRANILIVLFLGFLHLAFAQKVITGKSNSFNVDIHPKYELGLPPILFLDLSFKDENHNGILEAEEHAVLDLTISNKGNGVAQGLRIKVKDLNHDPALSVHDGQEIAFIYPDTSMTIHVDLKANRFIKSALHELKIIVSEHYGYDMDTATLIINTYQYEEPQLSFSGLEIFDSGLNTTPIISDKLLQAGEQVNVKLIVQNIGKNISRGTIYQIYSIDTNISIKDSKGELGDLGIGETKEIWVNVSPNKRVNVSGNLPIFLNVTNLLKEGEIHNFQIPLQLNKRPSESIIVKVEADLELFKAQTYKFILPSDRMTTKVQDIIEIKQVPHSKNKNVNAIGIIIGVEDYAYLTNAPYAANDALIMKEYFREVLGIEKIVSYINGSVNGLFFENYFNPYYGELQKKIESGVTDVFVYYSGHGIPSGKGDQVYLLPADGHVEAIEKQGYNLNTLFYNLDSLHAKSVTVFIDACFSGSSRITGENKVENLVAAKGARIKPQISQPWEENPGFSVFFSSSFDENSYGFTGSKTGLFTYFLCAGLKGEADLNKDNCISYGELFDYILSGVTSTSRKIGAVQTPNFCGNKKSIMVSY